MKVARHLYEQLVLVFLFVPVSRDLGEQPFLFLLFVPGWVGVNVAGIADSSSSHYYNRIYSRRFFFIRTDTTRSKPNRRFFVPRLERNINSPVLRPTIRTIETPVVLHTTRTEYSPVLLRIDTTG